MNRPESCTDTRRTWLSWDLDDTLYPAIPAYRDAKHARWLARFMQQTGQRDAAAARMDYDARLARRHGLILDMMAEAGIGNFEVLELVAGVDRSEWFRPDSRIDTILHELSAMGFRHGLLSNNLRATGRDILSRLAVDQRLFEVQIYREDTPRPKPSPDPFLRFITEAGVGAGEVVMIGDSLGADIRPAHALGMATVWMCPSGAVKDDPAVDAVATSLTACPDVLRRWAPHGGVTQITAQSTSGCDNLKQYHKENP